MTSPISPMSAVTGEVLPTQSFDQGKRVRSYRHVPYAQNSQHDSGSETASLSSNSATPRNMSHRSSGAAMSVFDASSTSIPSVSPLAQCGLPRSPSPQAQVVQVQAPQQKQQPRQKNQAPSTTMIVVSEDEFTRNVGNLKRLAFTASGSSLIQAAIRQHGSTTYDAVFTEVRDSIETMLMDQHACYVAKLLIESMSPRAREALLAELSANEQLWVSMCVRSLHSRRMVQFFLETYGIDQCAFLVLLVQRNFHTIAMSKEGCVTVQRILDRCGHGVREIFFTFIRCNFVAYSCDANATYVVQYMMRFGDADATVDGIVEQLRGGNAAMLCGNKYASPVLEKCIATLGSRFQRALVANLFQCMHDEVLCALLNDNYANYVVQALIDECGPECLDVIAARISSVQPLVQYGRKLLQRIQKRTQGGFKAGHKSDKW